MKTKQLLLLLLIAAAIPAMSFTPSSAVSKEAKKQASGEYVYFHSYGSKGSYGSSKELYVSDIIWIEGTKYGEEAKKNRIRYEKKFKSEIISGYEDEAAYVYMVSKPSIAEDKDGFELERAKYIKESKEKKYNVKQIYL